MIGDKKNNRTKTIPIRVTELEYQIISVMASDLGTNISDLIRKLLDQEFKKPTLKPGE